MLDARGREPIADPELEQLSDSDGEPHT